MDNEPLQHIVVVRFDGKTEDIVLFNHRELAEKIQIRIANQQFSELVNYFLESITAATEALKARRISSMSSWL